MRILIIDDDDTTLLITRERLRKDGHDVETRNQAIGTTNAIRSFAPTVVLIDIGMPAMSGYKLVELINSAKLETQVVLFSGRERSELAKRASELGALGYIHKDDSSEISERLAAMVERS